MMHAYEFQLTLGCQNGCFEVEIVHYLQNYDISQDLQAILRSVA